MIIWIASYPKSGNTWIRSFLSSYIYNQGKKFDFDDLLKIRAFPSDREINFLKKKFGIYKFTDMAKHWEMFQKDIIKNQKYVFLKTHNAAIKIDNNVFANLNNCIGLIYIIRDPRDVVLSYSSHLNLNPEKTFEIMQREDLIEKTNDNNDRTLITSWINHYNSWKHFPKEKILIKYEDLIDTPNETFLKLIKFLNKIINTKIDNKLIEKTVNNVSFDKLQRLENQSGFPENRSLSKNHKFFKAGKKKQWIQELDKNLILKLNKYFEKELKELNYN